METDMKASTIMWSKFLTIWSKRISTSSFPYGKMHDIIFHVQQIMSVLPNLSSGISFSEESTASIPFSIKFRIKQPAKDRKTHIILSQQPLNPRPTNMSCSGVGKELVDILTYDGSSTDTILNYIALFLTFLPVLYIHHSMLIKPLYRYSWIFLSVFLTIFQVQSSHL